MEEGAEQVRQREGDVAAERPVEGIEPALLVGLLAGLDPRVEIGVRAQRPLGEGDERARENVGALDGENLLQRDTSERAIKTYPTELSRRLVSTDDAVRDVFRTAGVSLRCGQLRPFELGDGDAELVKDVAAIEFDSPHGR